MIMALRPLTEVKSDLARIFDDMDRMVDPLFPAWRSLTRSADRAGYFPAMNLSLKDNTLTVEAAVPGYQPEDIDVEVENNVLSIRGQRETVREESGETLLNEIVAGRFVRNITLPAEVKAEEAQAGFKDGVLTITLPLAAQSRRTKVTIQ